jgi:hypothetical protein
MNALQNTARLLVCAAAFHLAGCAEMEWRKAGVEAPALDQDLQACRDDARTQAMSQSQFRVFSAAPIIGVDRGGGVNVAPAPPFTGEGERFLLEHDLTRACMTRRGYELVPAAKKS